MDFDRDYHHLSGSGEHNVDGEPSVAYLGKIFFHSFRHSQSIPLTQFHILEYVRDLHPKWKISEETFKEIEISSRRTIQKFIPTESQPFQKNAPHVALSASTISQELSEQLEVFKYVFLGSQRENVIDKRLLAKSIAAGILERDFYYTLPGKKRISSASSYFSYYCFYGLEQHSTGIWELDAMYQDVVTAVISGEIWQDKRIDFQKAYKVIVSKYFGVI